MKYTDLYLREISVSSSSSPVSSLLLSTFSPPSSYLSLLCVCVCVCVCVCLCLSIKSLSKLLEYICKHTGCDLDMAPFPLHHIPCHTHGDTHTDILCGNVIPINSRFLCCLADHCFKINLKDRKKHTKSSF